MEQPRYDQDGNSLYGPEGRYSDRFGDHIQPRIGFIYPESGAKITALNDFVTAGNDSRPGKGVIRAGDVGVVHGCRKPFTFDEHHGYMGLVVYFESVSKVYPTGFVLNWDHASDPCLFSIGSKPPTNE